MKRNERINAFVKLGTEIKAVLEGISMTEAGRKLEELIPVHALSNGWFTEANIRHRLQILAGSLNAEVMENWLSRYPVDDSNKGKTVAVILAGNIPMVGFDDFRCVLISGNNFLGKLSSDDKRMLPLVAEMLCEIEPQFRSRIRFAEARMSGMDAVIATGSNNSSRYFEHYFSKYPHIIRKNRNSVAVLDMDETPEELTALGEDIFRYFGLGCRNVTKLYVPDGYDFNKLYGAVFPWGEILMMNKKYMNNYDYHKTLYLLNKQKLLDNEFLLLKKDSGMVSPPGVIFYEYYSETDQLRKKLADEHEQIQCVVSHSHFSENAISFGKSQETGPGDYADGVDVMEFLCGL